MAVIEYDEYKQKLQALEPTLQELEKALSIPKAREELAQLQKETEQEGFWSDVDRSQKVSQQIKRLESKVKKYDRLVSDWEDTLTLCGYQFIVGGGLLLLTGLCFGGTLPHFTGQSLLLLGYMVLLSAVAQTIWSALTRYNPVGRVAVYGFLNPVFGVLLSALLLREGQQAFTTYSLAALVLVCVGIFVVNRSDAPGRGAQADQQP